MKYTLLLISLFFSQIAVFFAAHAENKVEEINGKKYEIVPNSMTTQIREDSSAYHRLNKDYQLTALLTGVGPSISSTAGIQLSKHLSANNALLVETTTGTNNWSSKDIADTKYGYNIDISTSSVGVHFKHYSGNSFYTRIGGDYRTVKYRVSYIYQGQEDLRNFDGDSVAANIQIGNQWQWESFTLGCDWIGYSLPISSNVKNSRVSSSTLEYDQRRLKEDSEVLVKGAHLNLLRFYIGASF